MSEKHAVSSLSKSVCIYRQISNQQMNQSPNYLSSSNKGRKYIHGPIFPNLISVNSFGNAFRHKTSTRRPLRKLPHSMPHIDHTINNSNSMASIQALNGRQSKFLSRVIAAKLCLQYNSNITGISVDRTHWYTCGGTCLHLYRATNCTRKKNALFYNSLYFLIYRLDQFYSLTLTFEYI